MINKKHKTVREYHNFAIKKKKELELLMTYDLSEPLRQAVTHTYLINNLLLIQHQN